MRLSRTCSTFIGVAAVIYSGVSTAHASEATCSSDSAEGRSLIQALRPPSGLSDKAGVVQEEEHLKAVPHKAKLDAHSASMLQQRRARSKTLLRSTWTTNAGQEYSSCVGSLFQTDFSGEENGLTVRNGIRLVKANCPNQGMAPSTSKLHTCGADSTGCHAWCAPVHISMADKANYTAMHERCSEWDTRHTSDIARNDPACSTLSTLVTWARTEVPANAAEVEMRFAAATACDQWCSPMWVTLYDSQDWSKFWRYCANPRGEWGDCDAKEEVQSGSWKDLTMTLDSFTKKFGYAAPLVMELAVYADAGAATTLIESINYVYKVETRERQPAFLQTVQHGDPALLQTQSEPTHEGSMRDSICGALSSCPSGNHCCRNQVNNHKAQCCPDSFVCCAEECCASFGTCHINEFTGVGTCNLPGASQEPPAICAL